MHNKLIISKMIDTIERIQSYTNQLSYDEFCHNDMLVDACIFNLSQLGEQANRIDEDFESMHPDIPWRQVYGLRNRIVHDYEGINFKLIWEIIDSDLPDLKEKLLHI